MERVHAPFRGTGFELAQSVNEDRVTRGAFPSWVSDAPAALSEEA